MNQIYNWQDKKILIADDEDINFYFLEAALDPTNAQIIRAKNGEQAIEATLRNNIDIILMDLNMPIMDGFEATRRIKLKNKSIPVIAQTAYTQFEMEEKYDENIFDACLYKPINYVGLYNMLERFL